MAAKLDFIQLSSSPGENMKQVEGQQMARKKTCIAIRQTAKKTLMVKNS